MQLGAYRVDCDRKRAHLLALWNRGKASAGGMAVNVSVKLTYFLAGSGSCARAYVIKSPLLALVAAQCDKTRLYMKVKMRRCAFDWMDLGMPG